MKKGNKICSHAAVVCVFSGDILGLLLDIDNQSIIFSLNGSALPKETDLFLCARWVTVVKYIEIQFD